MKREIHSWHSPRLNKNMEIAVYGHYGFALLLIPTAAADFLEYERFHLLNSIKEPINAGKVKVFSINSINSESWMNSRMHPRDKSIRHQQFNEYVFEEVIPFIKTQTSDETDIISCGASLGALHAANLFFRRPDLFSGVIAMSGDYNLSSYTKGYHDQDVYFNSPEQYLSNLNDDRLLNSMRSSNHIHILSGSGPYENPDASRRLSGILNSKSIAHELDIWGYDMDHDWPTWRAMLPHYINTRF
ncbi:MAG: esterase [Saprospiraceae bacterium]|nr:MAG: esterase [Saprospiraceae bacterium]